jgi:hypothetical protein
MICTPDNVFVEINVIQFRQICQKKVPFFADFIAGNINFAYPS